MPVWKALNHPNILPFCGVDMELDDLALVYDWCEDGNITQYLEKNPNADRPSLVRKFLLPRPVDIYADFISLYVTGSCWTWQKGWNTFITWTLSMAV